MSREAIQSFDEYGPYTTVDATGGLETPNGIFEGSQRNVSFAFEGDALDFIQVWNYEGNDFDVAKQRVLEVFHLFDDRFGGATVDKINVSGPNGLDRGAMNAVLDRLLGTAKDLTDEIRSKEEVEVTIMFDMIPTIQPEGSRLHSMWGYSSRFDTFYVFLFQDRADAPERRVESNVSLEKR